MNNISKPSLYFLMISFLFFVGSVLGWVMELFFRRFFSSSNPEHKWINPGFLAGPYLPIYGFGLTALFLMSSFPYVGIRSLSELTWVRTLVIILSMGFIMTFIEYIAGIIFIRKMHIKLWDYSDMWGNFQGIICPLFSLIWTVLGAIYYFFVQSHIVRLVTWYFNNIAFTFVVGMFYGILLIDLCYSLHVMNTIRKFADEHKIVVKYEELKAHIANAADAAAQKHGFLFAFKSEKPFREHLLDYKNHLADRREQLHEHITRASR